MEEAGRSARLQAQCEALEREIAMLRQMLDDTREDRNRWRQEAQQLLELLMSADFSPLRDLSEEGELPDALFLRRLRERIREEMNQEMATQLAPLVQRLKSRLKE
ncbi:hypothetical protein [Magnetofaba australis]|nr:hypothetical protein [Magnetofaba australis]